MIFLFQILLIQYYNAEQYAKEGQANLLDTPERRPFTKVCGSFTPHGKLEILDSGLEIFSRKDLWKNNINFLHSLSVSKSAQRSEEKF